MNQNRIVPENKFIGRIVNALRNNCILWSSGRRADSALPQFEASQLLTSPSLSSADPSIPAQPKSMASPQSSPFAAPHPSPFIASQPNPSRDLPSSLNSSEAHKDSSIQHEPLAKPQVEKDDDDARDERIDQPDHPDHPDNLDHLDHPDQPDQPMTGTEDSICETVTWSSFVKVSIVSC